MSLFGECTIKNITAEYVEEQLAAQQRSREIEEAVDVVEDIDIDELVNESYIDTLLEALELD